MSADTPNPDPRADSCQNHHETSFSPFIRHAASILAMVVFITIGLLFLWEMKTLILVIFLAILLSIFLRWLSDHLQRRTPLNGLWALLTVVIALLALTGGAGWLMAPAIATQVNAIREMIPQALDELQAWIAQTSAGPRILAELGALDPASFFTNEIIGQLGDAFAGGLNFLTNAALVLVVGVYLAIDPGTYKRGLIHLVPMHYRPRAETILNVCTHQMIWWLLGRLLAMGAVALIVAIGLWALGIPLPFTLGFIAGLFSFVPILGSIASFLPAALVALLVGPEFVLWAGLVFLGAQAIEGNLLTPIVQKRFVSLPHALTLISQVIGGILFGLVGVTVATPLAVLLMALVNMIYVEDVLGDTTPYTDLADRLH
ncbi:AI-2E family transporter [Bradymonadaceae bacterium TMQ3]|uniref:AI-2E family transporter n=1 Tax=Lujinxingia sediminis TaxID=2480984 RepID=A0ABY0CQL4_9DELT|nr:AI-2E family transporter [Lujinxingia sediminis]RDV36516.1 AI-2E family transporter [Bradymonadaceae bacterium TMQ3]RVU42370.1 AI-2E family transporter [Lujinxingia sediminis]TXC74569.1 AI-2E family transporter [Bradymonadales bacterium TMQ1]